MEQEKIDWKRRKSEWAEQNGKLRFFVLCIIAIAIVAVLVGGTVSIVENYKNKNVEMGVAQTASKPAPEIPPASEQNDLLEIAKNAQGEESKQCYLTFDDGPTTSVTPAILDVLKRYDVKATFFMLGRMIEANPELAKRAYDEGHLLANHGYSHDYKAMYATQESFIGEIEKTEGLIRDITGEEPFKLMRFPGGGHNAGDHAEEKQKYKLALKDKGYYFADWNALNGDAEGNNRSAEQLLSRMKGTATQKNIVVLMHDAAAKKTTADSLPAIIEYLKGQGYEFKRLDEIKYYSQEEKESKNTMIL